MKHIIQIVKSLEDSGLILKGVSEAIQNEAKKQKGWFLSTLPGTLDAILLRNILAGNGTNRAEEGAIAKSVSEETKLKRQGWGTVRAGYEKKKGRKATTKDHKNKMDF